ncbi:hypothetical protein R6Q59_019672 [Mikania micrantha]
MSFSTLETKNATWDCGSDQRCKRTESKLVNAQAELGKIAKHEKACAENQHAFIPFAFDTFGSLAHDAATFLKRVQQVVHSNSSTPKNANFVFSRIGFAIQKGVAAQLVARLPAFLL